LTNICTHFTNYFENLTENGEKYLAAKFPAPHATKFPAQQKQGVNYTLHSFDDPYNALEFVENGNSIDIAVLDIMMPGLSGIELAKKFRELQFNGYIIFLTAVNDFAAQSYSVGAFDYLLKPAAMPAIKKLMDRLLDDYKKSDSEGLNLKIKTEIMRLKFRELMFVEVKNHNLYFYLSGGKAVKAYAQLKEYSSAILADSRMIRANNSLIINIDYIKSFEGQAVFMQDGTRISITGSFKDFKNACYDRMFGEKK